ncbi:MAG: hypothetical protein QOJ71_2492 [Actinomycetota bacterium]|nr:hypothetical protein [Actinomycetota bacterium]
MPARESRPADPDEDVERLVTMGRLPVVALVAIVSATACGGGHNRGTRSARAPRAPTTTAVPRSTVPTPAPARPSTTTTTTPSGNRFTYSARQLAGALLRIDDLPPGFRSVAPGPADDGLCAGTVAAAAVPASTIARTEFTGPNAAMVREALRDFPGTSSAYLDAVRRDIRCPGYMSIPTEQIAAGIDTANGALGIGVSVGATAGNVVNIVWIRQGDLVIEVRASGGATSGVGSLIALAGQALNRLKNALA